MAQVIKPKIADPDPVVVDSATTDSAAVPAKTPMTAKERVILWGGLGFIVLAILIVMISQRDSGTLIGTWKAPDGAVRVYGGNGKLTIRGIYGNNSVYWWKQDGYVVYLRDMKYMNSEKSEGELPVEGSETAKLVNGGSELTIEQSSIGGENQFTRQFSFF